MSLHLRQPLRSQEYLDIYNASLYLNKEGSSDILMMDNVNLVFASVFSL